MDHQVIRRFDLPEMCGGCPYCHDVEYLSEDSEDSYFLHKPDNLDIQSGNDSLLDRELFNLYELNMYDYDIPEYESDLDTISISSVLTAMT